MCTFSVRNLLHNQCSGSGSATGRRKSEANIYADVDPKDLRGGRKAL